LRTAGKPIAKRLEPFVFIFCRHNQGLGYIKDAERPEMDNVHVAWFIARLAFGQFPWTMHIFVIYFFFADSMVGHFCLASDPELLGNKVALVLDRLCNPRIVDLSNLAGRLAGSQSGVWM